MAVLQESPLRLPGVGVFDEPTSGLCVVSGAALFLGNLFSSGRPRPLQLRNDPGKKARQLAFHAVNYLALGPKEIYSPCGIGLTLQGPHCVLA